MFFFAEASFTNTWAGNKVLNIGAYRLNKRTYCSGETVTWICNQQGKGCRVRVYTIGNKIVRHFQKHNH